MKETHNESPHPPNFTPWPGDGILCDPMPLWRDKHNAQPIYGCKRVRKRVFTKLFETIEERMALLQTLESGFASFTNPTNLISEKTSE